MPVTVITCYTSPYNSYVHSVCEHRETAQSVVKELLRDAMGAFMSKKTEYLYSYVMETVELNRDKF